MVRNTSMEKLQDIANTLRIECVRATEASKSGYAYNYHYNNYSLNFIIIIRHHLLKRQISRRKLIFYLIKLIFFLIFNNITLSRIK